MRPAYLIYATYPDGRRYPCTLGEDNWLECLAVTQVSLAVPIVVVGDGAEEVVKRLKRRGYRVEVES